MPDISLCENKKCPVKEHCYRFMAKPDFDRQSYATFTFKPKSGCEYFMEISLSMALKLKNK